LVGAPSARVSLPVSCVAEASRRRPSGLERHRHGDGVGRRGGSRAQCEDRLHAQDDTRLAGCRKIRRARRWRLQYHIPRIWPAPKTPMKRPAQPEEIAPAYVLLSSLPQATSPARSCRLWEAIERPIAASALPAITATRSEGDGPMLPGCGEKFRLQVHGYSPEPPFVAAVPVQNVVFQLEPIARFRGDS
jgi:hypothetical protein